MNRKKPLTWYEREAVQHHQLHEAERKLGEIRKALPSEATLATWRPAPYAFVQKLKEILGES